MNTKRAWIVAIVTIFAGIALALVQNKVAPCMTTLMEAFQIDMGTAGWLSSLFNLVGIAMAIPASIVLNKLGAKKGGIIALICAIAGSVIGLMTTAIPVLMLSRVIEGLGVGLIGVIGPSLISMWFPETKRGLPMAIWSAYQMGAQAVMFFVAGVVTTSFGWQGMWIFGAAACVIALVFYIICIKTPRPEENYADVEGENVSLAEGMKTPGAWIMALVTMFFCIACFGFVNWIATAWVQNFSWTEAEANVWVGYFSLGGVIAAVIIGAVLSKIRNRKVFGSVALVLYGVVSIVGMSMPTPTFILAFTIVYPFVDASFPCVLWTMAAQTVKKPELAGVALGVVNIGFNTGILLGPPIVGALAGAFGWAITSYFICGFCVIAAILLLFVKVYSAEDVAKEVPAEAAE